MILGIGADLIMIERVEKACRKEAFLTRIYTLEECRQAGGSASKLAGDFAVKESIAKALGSGFRSFMPIDIEVLRDSAGKPYVRLYRGAKKLQEDLGIRQFHVSISNTADYAMAFVVGEGEGL